MPARGDVAFGSTLELPQRSVRTGSFLPQHRHVPRVVLNEHISANLGAEGAEWYLECHPMKALTVVGARPKSQEGYANHRSGQ